TPTQISVEASAPGLFQHAVVSGSALLTHPAKRLDATIATEGLSPTVAAPYLKLFGLVHEMVSARFNCILATQFQLRPDGALAADLDLSNVMLQDEGRQLFNLPRASVHHVVADLASARLDLGDIAMDG